MCEYVLNYVKCVNIMTIKISMCTTCLLSVTAILSAMARTRCCGHDDGTSNQMYACCCTYRWGNNNIPLLMVILSATARARCCGHDDGTSNQMYSCCCMYQWGTTIFLGWWHEDTVWSTFICISFTSYCSIIVRRTHIAYFTRCDPIACIS